MSCCPFKMDLCTYSDLAINSRIIHKEHISRILYLYVPNGICAMNNPTSIVEVTDRYSNVGESVPFVHVENRPWIDVVFNNLNMEPGYHKYLVTFEQKCGEGNLGLYFAYTLQTDSPDRPYYYMQGDV